MLGGQFRRSKALAGIGSPCPGVPEEALRDETGHVPREGLSVHERRTRLSLFMEGRAPSPARRSIAPRRTLQGKKPRVQRGFLLIGNEVLALGSVPTGAAAT